MKENKEEFCAPCALAIPAALGAVGVGTTAGGSDEQEQQTRNIIFWSSIGILAVSVILFVYLKFFRKNCTQCRAK